MAKGGLPSDRLVCEVCGGKYTRANKVPHNKTKQHQQALKYESIIKNTINQQIPQKSTMLEVDSWYYDINGEPIRLSKKKADFYNELSQVKNGHPCYFRTVDDLNKVIIAIR